MECLSYNAAKNYDLNALEQHLKRTREFHFERHWNAISMQQEKGSERNCFVFSNGTVVCWGFKRYQSKDLLNLLQPFSKFPVAAPLYDSFSANLGMTTTIKPHRFYNVDMITLTSWETELQLAISYGLSQSIKLQYFENRTETLIEKYTPFTTELAHHGHMPLPRRAIRKIIGEILGAKSELNLTSNFLYQPKFFWSHPTLEAHFAMIERYLDLPQRAETLNHRLDTLKEVFDMFNTYLESKHAHTLEIVIIVLIAIEIVIGLLKLHY